MRATSSRRRGKPGRYQSPDKCYSEADYQPGRSPDSQNAQFRLQARASSCSIAILAVLRRTPFGSARICCWCDSASHCTPQSVAKQDKFFRALGASECDTQRAWTQVRIERLLVEPDVYSLSVRSKTNVRLQTKPEKVCIRIQFFLPRSPLLAGTRRLRCSGYGLQHL